MSTAIKTTKFFGDILSISLHFTSPTKHNNMKYIQKKVRLNIDSLDKLKRDHILWMPKKYERLDI